MKDETKGTIFSGAIFIAGLGIAGGIILHEKMEEQCKYLLHQCEITLDAIRNTWEKYVKEDSSLTDEEKARLQDKSVKMINDATNLVVEGKTKNSIIAKKHLYKKAAKMYNEIYVHLISGEYGWFYN